MNNLITEFTMDYGTTVTTASMTEVKAHIDDGSMIDEYAAAYLRRMQRANPLRYERLEQQSPDIMTTENLSHYFRALLYLRIQVVNSSLQYRREIRLLNVPVFIQCALRLVGRVVDTDRGITIVPVMDEVSIDINNLLETSECLSWFMNDGLHLVDNAFDLGPKSEQGDPEFMKMAIFNGDVMTDVRLAHPVKAYFAAFLGQTFDDGAKEVIAFRVRYDEVSFIKLMLLHDEVIY